MEQRPLGSTGLQVSALGFGCGAVGGLMVRGTPEDQRQAVTRALDAGVTYFDTAALYGDGASEDNLGRTMRELGTWQRVVVGTKVRLPVGEPGWASAAVRQSLEASLRRLGRSDVDVFHLHNPVGLAEGGRGVLDLETVLGEVAEALAEVKTAGLARHVGFTGLGDSTAVREVIKSELFETVQAYFNVLNPSAGYIGHTGGQQDFEGLIDTAALAGCGVIVIRVLAAGAATGSAERPGIAGDPGGGIGGSDYADDVARAARLGGLAAELGMESPIELALRFGLSKSGVSTVLVGYSTLQHLEEAIRFAERGALSEAAVKRVLEASAA
jgi:L-galactose dehydrogenase/L-glyceraldehyde 3-phosphate reductase